MDLDSRTDEQVRLLADSHNRAVMNLLDDADAPLHVEVLADRLVSQDVGVISSSAYEDRLERMLISLHHDWLPRLAEAGLVEYDTGANVVSHGPSRVSDTDWENESVVDAMVTHLPSEPATDDGTVGVLEGRETVIRHGRRLADRAEDELFCMYVSTDLLEDECISRAENAIDRGVSLYVGSGNPEVRDLTRRHLPEATIWEPQLDWLNAPTFPRVGRLVLADRRSVMVAVFDEEKTDDTSPGETALVGDGVDNPLVVLVRDLLGSRLDHLDYQSTEFRSGLRSHQ